MFKVEFHGDNSEKPLLHVIRNREHPNNDPWVWGDLVKLLRRAKKEMKICLQERVEVLAPYLGQSAWLVTFCRFQTIPVESANFPVQYLEFVAFPGCVLESVREVVW